MNRTGHSGARVTSRQGRTRGKELGRTETRQTVRPPRQRFGGMRRCEEDTITTEENQSGAARASSGFTDAFPNRGRTSLRSPKIRLIENRYQYSMGQCGILESGISAILRQVSPCSRLRQVSILTRHRLVSPTGYVELLSAIHHAPKICCLSPREAVNSRCCTLH